MCDKSDNPCKNCQERCASCHSVCLLYINWKKEYDDTQRRIKKREYTERIIREDLVDKRFKNIKKFKRI